MLKELDVIMLYTEKPSVLGLDKTLQYFHKDNIDNIPSGTYANQHLYIISDKEIKEGYKGLCIVTVKDDTRIKYVVKVLASEKDQVYFSDDRKFTREHYSFNEIIATTNPEFTECTCGLDKGHKMGCETKSVVQIAKIPRYFIERFVADYNNGTPIKKVSVEYNEVNVVESDENYDDNILVVNSCGVFKWTHEQPERIELEADKYRDKPMLYADNSIVINLDEKTYTNEDLYWACIKCVELYEVENKLIDSDRIQKPSEVVDKWLSKNYPEIKITNVKR